jgi:hypothetical protein
LTIENLELFGSAAREHDQEQLIQQQALIETSNTRRGQNITQNSHGEHTLDREQQDSARTRLKDHSCSRIQLQTQTTNQES